MTGAVNDIPPRRGTNWRRWLIQAGVSLAILGVLFWFLPTGEIVDGLSRVSPPLFASVAALFLGIHLFAASKWWLQIGRVVSLSTALKAHYIGLTANLCLPGVAGGDAARIAVAWPSATDRSRLAAGSITDRLIDLAALCCVALFGLVFAENSDTGLAITVLPVALAIFVIGLWIGPRIVAALWQAVPKLPARSFVLKTCETAAEIGKRPGFLAGIFLMSCAIQSALIIISFWLAMAAGVEVSIFAWAFAWALAKLIVVVPITLGGLGVREALLAGLLAPFGAAAADAVAGGLAWQAVLWSGGLVGGVLLIATSRGFVLGASKGQGT